MKKAIVLPRKFIQGRGVINEVGDYAAMLGAKAVVLWGARTKAAVGQAVVASLAAAEVTMIDVPFNGETTKAEARRVADLAEGADLIVGVGGGKVVDTAKAAAIWADLPHIIVPTVASNDAPTSACTVWYDEAGVMVGFDLWKANPDYILVDTEVVAKAPVRLFVAGIGDAFATWFEAEQCEASGAVSCAGGRVTLTAMAMASLCRDTLLDCGIQAIMDVKTGAVTPAVDKVVEATTLLSGIGWESGGLATAHAIGNGLPSLPETHQYFHGEKVSFGVATQLVLDPGCDPACAREMVEFLAQAGLPVTFAELGIDQIGSHRLDAFTKDLAGEGSFVHNHPFEVTAADLRDAMLGADALGRSVLSSLAH
jgi:glycerol dehydrogenase